MCEVSDIIVWNATSVDPTTDLATQALCANSCLTQTVVLNAPGGDNLGDLREMCDGIRIEDYPFIEAMLFANLVVDDNGKVVALGTNTTVTTSSGEQPSGSDRAGQRVGIKLVTSIFLLHILVSCLVFPWAGPQFFL